MYISSETDFDNPEEVPYDPTQTKWFVVKANLSHTEREKEETKAAVLKQIRMGIIQQNGLPADISPEMLGLKTPAPPNTQHLRPQQRIQMARLQQQQSNSNLSYLNRPKLTQEQLLYQRFGLRK